MSKKISLVITAALMLALGSALTVHAASASAPQQESLPGPLLKQTIDYFDLRDAPVRQALSMLFNAGHCQYSVDNNVSGFLTLRAAGQSGDADFRLICRASSIPLTASYENGVYFVKTLHRNDKGPSVPSYATDTAVSSQRRVAGILLRGTGSDAPQPLPSYAILETGPTGSPATDVRIVTLGETVPMQAGESATPLHVAAIDREGLLLEGADGSRTRVRLMNALTGK